MYLWDVRNLKEATWTFQGHVPVNHGRLNRIHHPTFYDPTGAGSNSSYILTGGQGSRSLTMFEYTHSSNANSGLSMNGGTVYSRGKLPNEYSNVDVGCIAVSYKHHRNSDRLDLIATSVDGGDVLLLAPRAAC